MTVLTVSLVANAILLLALGFLWFRARARIVEEKVATFAGFLGAVTFSIIYDDATERTERLAVGLKTMKSEFDVKELRWRLVRAGLLRSLRGSPNFADVGGEFARALVAQATFANDDAEEVWAYVDGKLAGKDGFQEEPRERFGDARLAAAQLHLEGEIIRTYDKAVRANPLWLIR